MQDFNSPQIYVRFKAISKKIPRTIFLEINNLVLKFVWKLKKAKNSINHLEENNKVERLTVLNVKVYISL